jgi:hypothetical protein
VLTPSGIDGSSEPEYKLEGAFGLLQYPSPAISDERIEYFVFPVRSQVKLASYDVTGRHVRTIVGEHKTVGKHTCLWNPTDDKDRVVAAGICFLHLRLGTQETTRKVMVLR